MSETAIEKELKDANYGERFHTKDLAGNRIVFQWMPSRAHGVHLSVAIRGEESWLFIPDTKLLHAFLGRGLATGEETEGPPSESQRTRFLECAYEFEKLLVEKLRAQLAEQAAASKLAEEKHAGEVVRVREQAESDIWCSYCGESEDGTEMTCDEMDAWDKAHIATCTKHPLHAANKKIAHLRDCNGHQIKVINDHQEEIESLKLRIINAKGILNA